MSDTHHDPADHSHAGESDDDRAERMEDEGAAMAPVKLSEEDAPSNLTGDGS